MATAFSTLGWEVHTMLDRADGRHAAPTETAGTVPYSEPDGKLAASQAGLRSTEFTRHFLEATFVEAS
jgi:hypothetical protein